MRLNGPSIDACLKILISFYFTDFFISVSMWLLL